MQGNFIYFNPTKLCFGPNSLNCLKDELKNYGSRVLLVYGKNSIKKNGIYDKVIHICKNAKKTIDEVSGIVPNPTLNQLYKGIKIARRFKPDLILAIGGGSVIDYAKGLSACAYAKGDIWDKYWIKKQNLGSNCKITPIGAILTMVGTGSEMNGTSVITNEKEHLKCGRAFPISLYPKFAILNPEFTFTVSYKQMVCGIFDIFAHICEQYFSGNDENVSDYLSVALAKSVISASKKAIKNPRNYEARSNLMWAATWALNTLIKKGKTEDWNPHKISHAISAYVDATHGAALSAIYHAYHNFMMPYGIDKYVSFAIDIWNINPKGKTKKQIAQAGLKAMDKWIRELKLPNNIKQLGVTRQMIEPISKSIVPVEGGYKKLTSFNIKQILLKSFE